MLQLSCFQTISIIFAFHVFSFMLLHGTFLLFFLILSILDIFVDLLLIPSEYVIHLPK